MMRPEVLQGVFIPFLGTVLGSACVFFLKGQMPRVVQRSLTGFAAGVMTAASVWSLLIPAMDQSEHLGKLAFLPAFIGLWVGVLFLLALVGSTDLPCRLAARLPEKARVVLQPLLVLVLLVLVTACLVDGSFNPFLYFRF